jgi:hypothetical protein
MTEQPADQEVQAAVQASPPAGFFLTTLVALYLAVFVFAMVTAFVQLWPVAASPTPAAPNPNLGNSTRLWLWNVALSSEARILLLVVCAGALGSLAHALRSFAWYVGSRKLVRSWLLYYVFLPFTGATLAAALYFVIRAGFFSTGTSVAESSPFGFVALGTLAGMFSENTIEKLKEVAGSILAPSQKGEDHYDGDEDDKDDGS